MRNITTCLLSIAVAVATTAGCGAKNQGAANDDKPAAAAAPAATAKPTEPPPATTASSRWLRLAPLSVQIQVPADSKASDQSEGELKTAGIDTGSAMFSVSIVPADMKLTYDQMVTALNGGGTKVTQKEKLADGFHVEATTEGGSIQIDVHRTIAGIEYNCGTLAPDAETAHIVRTACLTLKASS